MAVTATCFYRTGDLQYERGQEMEAAFAPKGKPTELRLLGELRLKTWAE